MNFVDFVGKEVDLKPPKDWRDTDRVTCRALPIKTEHVGEFLAKVSYWKPSPEELELLNSGACVKLSILGPISPTILAVEQVEIINAATNQKSF